MGKKASFKGKKQYGIYASEIRFSKNKLRKLQKHVGENPDDSKAAEDLNRLSKSRPYTRKASFNKIWNESKKKFASLLKTVGYKGNIALIDADKDPKKFKAAFGFTYGSPKNKNSENSQQQTN